MDASAKYLSRSDLVARYGVGMKSLSDYEELGLLRPAAVVGLTNYYTARECARLELILKGRRFGFSLSEIAKLIGHAQEIAGRLERHAE